MQVRAPDVEQVCPPGLAVTVYRVIGVPPFEAGVVQAIGADVALGEAALGASGMVGGPSGTTGFEVPAGPVPAPLIAATRKVYCVPLVRPVTVQVSVSGVATT